MQSPVAFEGWVMVQKYNKIYYMQFFNCLVKYVKTH